MTLPLKMTVPISNIVTHSDIVARNDSQKNAHKDRNQCGPNDSIKELGGLIGHFVSKRGR